MPSQCTACRLPVEARRQIESAYRRKVPIRQIATDLAIAGHAVSAASVHRHCTRCLVPADVDTLDPLSLVVLVRNALKWQHSAAEKVTDALISAGATAEAAVMATACLESYRPALDVLPGDHYGTFVLESYALADVVGRVLQKPSASNVATAIAMADEAAALGADMLADALRDVASRAAGEQNVRSAAGPTADRANQEGTVDDSH